MNSVTPAKTHATQSAVMLVKTRGTPRYSVQFTMTSKAMFINLLIILRTETFRFHLLMSVLRDLLLEYFRQLFEGLLCSIQ